MHRVPAIDGLRTVAVMAVIALHSNWGLPGGYLGVDIFFVLSGFLITRLLLNKQETEGRISIGEFYWHRFVRLSPAAIFATGCYIVIASVVFQQEIQKHLWEALHAITYVMNINIINWWGATGYLNHTWSLAIEEQFYLIWAPLTVLAAGLYGRRGVALSAVCAIIAVVLWRYSISLWPNRDLAFWRVYHGFDTRCDELLIGCLLAATFDRRVADLASRTWVIPSGFLIYGMFNFGNGAEFVLSPFGLTSVAIAAAWIIIGLASQRRSWLSIALSSPAMVYIGKLSYAMYLWNWLLIKLMTTLEVDHGRTIAFAGTLIAAAISYHLIEKPAARLRDWRPFLQNAAAER